MPVCGRHGKRAGGTFRVSTLYFLSPFFSSSGIVHPAKYFQEIPYSQNCNQHQAISPLEVYCVFYSNLALLFPFVGPQKRPQHPPNRNGHRLLSVSWHCIAKGPVWCAATSLTCSLVNVVSSLTSEAFVPWRCSTPFGALDASTVNVRRRLPFRLSLVSSPRGHGSISRYHHSVLMRTRGLKGSVRQSYLTVAPARNFLQCFPLFVDNQRVNICLSLALASSLHPQVSAGRPTAEQLGAAV